MEQRTRREKLATVLRRAGALVTVEDAAEALGVSRKIAARTLWRWHRQGWLSNLRRGLYAPVPLDAMSGKQVLPEPWILVPDAIRPGVHRRLVGSRALGPDGADVPEPNGLHGAANSATHANDPGHFLHPQEGQT